MSDYQWKLQKICGDSQVKRRVVCSFDSKYLLTTCGNRVRVYARQTGQLVEELIHHSDTVTGIALDRRDNAQVYTCSLDGQIALWDYKDGGLLKTIDVGTPMHRLCVRPNNAEPSLFVSVYNQEGEVIVKALPSIVLTTPQEHVAFSEQPPLLILGKRPNELTFTFDSKHLVTSTRKELVLYDCDSRAIFRYSAISVIVSLACHPSCNCIATGSIGGEIQLWYNVGSDDLVKTRLHWHVHAVADLCFSTDGTYLLSGGEEAVLVLWQLATEQKHFRPRLGAPIVGVACCPGDQTYAISLQNNAIQLVSGMDNEVSHTIVQLYRALFPGLDRVGGVVPTGLVYDPRTHSVVLNGSHGQLQFFNCDTSTIKCQLEIVGLNVVSRPHKKPITPTVINHVAFNTSGQWLATSEEWNNEVLSAERKLKFWKFNSDTQAYTVMTTIDQPHNDTVTGLSFRPRNCDTISDIAVTTSLDGTFKVWLCSEVERNDKRRVTWACRSQGKYHNLPCLDCSFSEDGSLLALNNGKYITLWDPVLCEHRKSFNSPVVEDRFKQVTFGSLNNSHLLLASSSHYFHVWNLLTCEGVLTVPLTVNVMVCDMHSDRVALFTPNDLYFFSTRTMSPVLVQSDIPSVTSGVFIPTNDNSCVTGSQLYFIDNDQLLYTLSDQSKERQDIINKELNNQESQQMFYDIFGTRKGKQSSSTGHIRPTRYKPSTLLDAPPHLLPPMSAICHQFLLSLVQSTSADISNDDSEGEEIGDKSEDDSENDWPTGPEVVGGADCVAMETISVDQVKMKSKESNPIDYTYVFKKEMAT